jgi:hypothetical protein
MQPVVEYAAVSGSRVQHALIAGYPAESIFHISHNSSVSDVYFKSTAEESCEYLQLRSVDRHSHDSHQYHWPPLYYRLNTYVACVIELTNFYAREIRTFVVLNIDHLKFCNRCLYHRKYMWGSLQAIGLGEIRKIIQFLKPEKKKSFGRTRRR